MLNHIFENSQDRPDMRTSRAAWEKPWEQGMDNSYRRRDLLNMSYATFASRLFPDVNVVIAPDSSLLQMEILKRSMCKLQEDLAKDFAALSRRSGLASQTKSDATSFWRASIERCASGSGKPYLRMLEELTSTDFLQPTSEPKKIEHPVMDRLFLFVPGRHEEARGEGDGTIVHTAPDVLPHLGLPEQPPYDCKEEHQVSAKPTGSKADNAAVREPFKDDPEVSDVFKQHRRIVKDLRYGCWSCDKNEKMLPPGAKLMARSKCRTIDRKVWYCSRERQVEDWRRPRTHQLICGKPLDEEHIEPASDDHPGQEPHPPHPIQDTSGPPALLHQITLLSAHPELDYLVRTLPIMTPAYRRSLRVRPQLVRSYPHPDHGVIFTHTLGALSGPACPNAMLN
ncbi:hypothetical protein NM688_g7798 [Phlebia brevispora]|uniref:Uncharacterized protein n=1 Tax=Phlebia brevispora TaxID=194682 RepID=A0ACC1S176_9APHY|nr:hypothetical protein NM688_g7798 [Phlebia brevispora]